jgi:hypothetical protein
MVFNVTFNYISVRFIGGGNRCTQRKPSIKPLLNVIIIRKMILCFILHWGRRDRMVV